MGDQVTLAQQQDNLRPLRAFVGAISGWVGSDQTMAATDNGVNNPPRQFVVIGPNGISVEGQPTSGGLLGRTAGGGFVLSPMLIVLGVLGYVLWKKG